MRHARSAKCLDEPLVSVAPARRYAVVSHASARVVAAGHATIVNYDYQRGVPMALSAAMERALGFDTHS